MWSYDNKNYNNLIQKSNLFIILIIRAFYQMDKDSNKKKYSKSILQSLQME
jgi:predicted lactoylglutathione lyase